MEIKETNFTKGRSTKMGMAASQARFLGLTARKTNVEFEGQQINQQRTTLSNQSANYYNDLLGMSVPVPPSVDDYTKTVYTFEDGALTNQITAMIAQTDGSYIVSYTRQWKDDFSVVSASTSIVNTQDKVNGPYKVGSTTLRTIGEEIDFTYTENENGNYFQYLGNYILEEIEKPQSAPQSDVQWYSYEDEAGQTKYLTYNEKNDLWSIETNVIGNSWMSSPVSAQNTPKKVSKSYNGDDEYLKTLSESQIENLMREEQEYLEMLKLKYGDDDYLVRYIKNSSTGEYVPYFYKQDDLEQANYDDKGNSQSNINCYTIGSETKAEEVKAIEGCKLEKDSSGRYINITIPSADGQTEVTYALTTTTVTDQDAYEDAMNQYEFDKQEYDQAIDQINAKIEIIQAQDKNLELRLKQLDTEQDAIQTEMDAVQKVIEKNTESTFKTFG